MGTDYAQVHLWWTLPPAAFLWLGLRRLRTRREVYKTTALILIAITATIPWDSYLIRNKIWSYPPSSCIGPTLAAIPLEEVFFFFIQTYITSCAYALCSRPVVHVLLLPSSKLEADRATRVAIFGVTILLGTFAVSVDRLYRGGEWTYMALIVGWVSPFLALLWGVASSHIIAMPLYSIAVPIILPTVYLWICDALALQRGTWVIERGTKVGLAFHGLEIEEAVFFLLTNVMVVFGLIACDHCLAIYDATTNHHFQQHAAPRPVSALLGTIAIRPQQLPHDRLKDLRAATCLLRDKSKSFYTANFIFEGRLQLNLLSLYAWCRVADDLVDEADSSAAASKSISLISSFLDLIYDSKQGPHPLPPSTASRLSKFDLLLSDLNAAQQATFRLLSDLPITRGPLEELLRGFRTDIAFNEHNSAPLIADEDALLQYASNVASSVADLCVQLVWAEYEHAGTIDDRIRISADSRKMGQALQLVNIARDVPADAKLGRVYLPRLPLATLRREGGVADASRERLRLLALAKGLAEQSQPTIELLPGEARGGIRAACAVYLEIGHAVEKAIRRGDVHGRARISLWRRILTAWRALGA